MKRLIKKSDSDNPMNFFIGTPEEKIEPKNDATKITYGPSISKEWLFEKPIDNPEWALRDSMGKIKIL